MFGKLVVHLFFDVKVRNKQHFGHACFIFGCYSIVNIANNTVEDWTLGIINSNRPGAEL